MASALERAVARVLAGTVTKEDVSSHEIDDAGATQLADALRTNTGVKGLYLSRNTFGDAGATQLADALHTNTSLKELGHGAPGEIMPALVTFDFD